MAQSLALGWRLDLPFSHSHVCLTKNSVTSVAIQCHRIHQVTMPDLFVATEIYESQPLQCVASTVHCTVKPCSCELCLSQGHVHVTLTI